VSVNTLSSPDWEVPSLLARRIHKTPAQILVCSNEIWPIDYEQVARLMKCRLLPRDDPENRDIQLVWVSAK
jgi:hypothetical protein